MQLKNSTNSHKPFTEDLEVNFDANNGGLSQIIDFDDFNSLPNQTDTNIINDSSNKDMIEYLDSHQHS